MSTPMQRSSLKLKTMTPKLKGSFLFKDKSLLNLNENNEEKIYQFKLQMSFTGYHHKKIVCLEISKAFGLVFSLDEDGYICIWDLNGSFIRKFRTPHPYNGNIYRHILENKSINIDEINIEKPLHFSFLEQNGDFAIVSSNYISLYNINGVLLAMERSEKAKFTTVLLVQNNEVFEEDYIFTGDQDGLIKIWLMERNDVKNYNPGLYYRDPFKNLGQKPFKLSCIYLLSLYEKKEGDYYTKNQHKIVSLTMSPDQKRLYSCHSNSEIYQWNVNHAENEDGNKKCNNCKTNFGLLDKKNNCTRCNCLLCNNCSKNEVFNHYLFIHFNII